LLRRWLSGLKSGRKPARGKKSRLCKSDKRVGHAWLGRFNGMSPNTKRLYKTSERDETRRPGFLFMDIFFFENTISDRCSIPIANGV
jgi:hypothetical protein